LGAIDVQIDASGAGLLDVQGSASLTGTMLDVSLINGFTPSNGASYEILETGSGVTGMFTDPMFVDGRITFTADIVGNDVFLNAGVGSVPEPSSRTLAMLGAAAVCAASALRRSKVRALAAAA
jgi:PEP-CTERM motif